MKRGGSRLPPSLYIFCPLKESVVKVDGKYQKMSTVGANMSIEFCMRRECTCKEFEERVEEIRGRLSEEGG